MKEVQKQKQIGERIKIHRKIAGVSTYKMPSITGISQSVLAKIENGNKKTIDFEQIGVISKAIKTPTIYILEGCEKFIEVVENIMKRDKLSLEELSKKIGVSVNDLRKAIESNGNLPYKEYKKIIEQIVAFGNTDYFYDFAGFQTEIYKNDNNISNLNSLINKEQIQQYVLANVKDVPVVGVIRAGQPILADENIEGYFPVDEQFISDEYEYFYLRVTGDSMDKEFKDGSLVLVQKQDYIKNNEIGVVLIDGMDATVKRIVIEENLITLIPCSNNLDHITKTYDMNKVDVHILGKVVLAIKKY
jgi:repressor LexA